jgi:hypothetical protein
MGVEKIECIGFFFLLELEHASSSKLSALTRFPKGSLNRIWKMLKHRRHCGFDANEHNLSLKDPVLTLLPPCALQRI